MQVPAEQMEIALTIALAHQRFAEHECGYEQDSDLVCSLQMILDAIINKETVVVTNNGPVCISDLTIGDKVLTGDGSYQQLTDRFFMTTDDKS